MGYSEDYSLESNLLMGWHFCHPINFKIILEELFVSL